MSMLELHDTVLGEAFPLLVLCYDALGDQWPATERGVMDRAA